MLGKSPHRLIFVELALPSRECLIAHLCKLPMVERSKLLLMLCLRGLGKNARRNNRNSSVVIKRARWIIKHKREVA